MIAWWWSWLLAGVGVTGLWAAGSRKAWGWAVGFGAQILWIAYALATGQHGFIVAALAYGTVYARNWLAWRRASRNIEAFIRHDPRVEPEWEPSRLYEAALEKAKVGPGMRLRVRPALERAYCREILAVFQREGWTPDKVVTEIAMNLEAELRQWDR